MSSVNSRSRRGTYTRAGVWSDISTQPGCAAASPVMYVRSAADDLLWKNETESDVNFSPRFILTTGGAP